MSQNAWGTGGEAAGKGAAWGRMQGSQATVGEEEQSDSQSYGDLVQSVATLGPCALTG